MSLGSLRLLAIATAGNTEPHFPVVERLVGQLSGKVFYFDVVAMFDFGHRFLL